MTSNVAAETLCAHTPAAQPINRGPRVDSWEAT